METLNDEKQNLEIESSKIDKHKDEYSNLYQEYNKAVIEKNNKVKEKMTYKLHGRDSFWEMLKWRMYFQAIPEDLVLNLNMEHFDSLKNLFLINDKIDIIQENLAMNFLTNEQLKDENLSMYGVAKDLFIQINIYQNYVNIVREQFLLFETSDQLEEYKNETIFKEVLKNFDLINNLFNLLRDNEFSSQFCFSSIQETNLLLKQEINFDDH